MKKYLILLIVLVALGSCKKNAQKVIKEWRLVQLTEFDSLGDRKNGYSYSEICPYQLFKIEENVWSKYDEDCNGSVQNASDGIYNVEEDSLVVEGFDQNQDWFQDWYLITKINRSKFEFELWQSFNDSIGDWEVVDKIRYEYKLKK